MSFDPRPLFAASGCGASEADLALPALIREALSAGSFQTAVQCLTEDARDEWIGEMLVAIGERQSLGNVKGRWQNFVTDQQDPMSAEIMATFFSHQEGLFDAITGCLAEPEVVEVLNDPGALPSARRAACIRLAQKLSNRNELLVKLLEARVRMKESMQLEWVVGQTLSDPEPPRSESAPLTPRLQLSWASPRDLPSLEVEFLLIDGLWKLNTIIDPALKPWPRPVEEKKPPADEAPAGGATGVP